MPLIDLTLDWQVITGDCMKVLQEIPNDSVHAIITDPPYNAINRATSGLRSLDKGIADSAPIDIESLAAQFWRIATESFYVWCSDEQYTAWSLAFKNRGATTRKCVWHKTNPSPMNGQRLWLSALELCVFARKPQATFNRHCAHPVWDVPVQRVAGHPTPKPVRLMREQVSASLPPGGLVLDPFCGSGSTGIAAIQEGCRFIGIEQSPEYAALASSRIAEASESYHSKETH